MDIKALIYREELNSNDEVLIDTKIFKDVKDIRDPKIQAWEYKTVLNYDSEYDLINYDTGPYFNIYYIDNKGNTIKRVDMTEEMYGI